MPSLFSNTLTFTDPSEITFTCSSNELRVFVKGTLLGSINADYPVTMYVTVNNGVNSLTITQISNSVYTQANTNNPMVDTVYYDFNNRNHPPCVVGCTTSPTTYKMYGWDDDVNGQVCIGSNSFTSYFNISTNCTFKAKIEQVMVNNQPKMRLVARYSGNVYLNVNAGIADCFNSPYCYACNI